MPLAFDVKPELVAALGLSAVAAWTALTWRGELHPGEQVMVSGAGGTVGQVAVQAARLRGARRVIARCRSEGAAERARRCGADAVVRLDTEDVAELARRFTDASDGPADLVIDSAVRRPSGRGAAHPPALRAARPAGQRGRGDLPDRQLDHPQPVPSPARLHQQRAHRVAAGGRAQHRALLRRRGPAQRRLRVGVARRYLVGVGPAGPRPGPPPHRRDLLVVHTSPISLGPLRSAVLVPNPAAGTHPMASPHQPAPGTKPAAAPRTKPARRSGPRFWLAHPAPTMFALSHARTTRGQVSVTRSIKTRFLGPIPAGHPDPAVGSLGQCQ